MMTMLKSDFYQLLKLCKSWILAFGLMLILTLVQKQTMFMIFYSTFLAFMLPYTLASFDEQSQWLSHLTCLPISRGDLVRGRYLTILLFSLVMNGLGLLCTLPLQNYQAALILCSVGIVISLVTCSVTLPLVFKFGSQKARIAVMLFCILPAVVVPFLKLQGEVIQFPAYLSKAWFHLALIGASLLLYLISSFISTYIVQKTEF